MERVAVRAVGAAAAGAAIWLGHEVRGQEAIRGERWAATDEGSRSRGVRELAEAVTTFGYPWMSFPIAFLIAAGCRQRGVRGGSIVPASALLSWAAHRALKLFVLRLRPLSQRGQANYRRAYPSGHTTAVAAVATSTAYLLWTNGRPARDAVLVSVAPPALVGASRVVLGRHWPTDVVGGWAVGVAAVAYVVTREWARMD